MEWVSAKDVKPFPYFKVVVWITPPGMKGYCDIGMWEGDKWYVVTNKHTVEHVTHWGELEEPKV